MNEFFRDTWLEGLDMSSQRYSVALDTYKKNLSPQSFSQGALEMFAAEVKARKVCLDEGFKWGGEDVRMGEGPL